MAQGSASSSPLPFPAINPSRLRSYLLRLPLFTRIVLLACIGFWLLELQTVWSVTQWGALIPKEIGLQSLYRLNTFPFIHLGFLHMLVNVLCLIPLMERFEKEQGTLVSLLMFLGRMTWPRVPRVAKVEPNADDFALHYSFSDDTGGIVYIFGYGGLQAKYPCNGSKVGLLSSP